MSLGLISRLVGALAWLAATRARALLTAAVAASSLAGGAWASRAGERAPEPALDLPAAMRFFSGGGVEALPTESRRAYESTMVESAITIDLDKLRTLKAQGRGNPQAAQAARRYIEGLTLVAAQRWVGATPPERERWLDLAIVAQDWHYHAMLRAYRRMTPQQLADERLERALALERLRWQLSFGNAQRVVHAMEFIAALQKRRHDLGRPDLFLPSPDQRAAEPSAAVAAPQALVSQRSLRGD